LKLAEEQAAALEKEILAEARYVDEIEASRLRSGEIELKQARNELRRVEANIDRMVIKAPLDGIAWCSRSSGARNSRPSRLATNSGRVNCS
jgi:multidrug resistance efflux pump